MRRRCSRRPSAAQRSGEALALLQRRYAASPSIDVLEAHHGAGRQRPLPDELADDDRAADSRVTATSRIWRTSPRWSPPRAGWPARHFADEQYHPQVQRALDQATRPLMRYRCAACGFEAHQHFWHCPGCQAWDSYPPRRVEEL